MENINQNGAGGSWSDVGQGALRGASMGSAVGPWGAAVGGLLGAGYGWLTGKGNATPEESPEDKQRRQLQDFYNEAMRRGDHQTGPANQADYSSFRTNQSDLIGRLEALSKGQGPSLAAQQFQQATDRNMAAQQSMAQSGRGGPLAALNAANNMGQLGAQAAQGSAAARTQEQQMALNQLGLTIHGARGADESLSQFNANERNQTALANLSARLQAMGMNDSTRLNLLSQMQEQQKLAAAQSMAPSKNDQYLAGLAGAASLWSTRGKDQPQGGDSFKSKAALDALAARQQANAYGSRGGF